RRRLGRPQLERAGARGCRGRAAIGQRAVGCVEGKLVGGERGPGVDHDRERDVHAVDGGEGGQRAARERERDRHGGDGDLGRGARGEEQERAGARDQVFSPAGFSFSLSLSASFFFIFFKSSSKPESVMMRWNWVL